ncbi:hypothetical protein KAR91_57075 [Candidatus Pacearchaeota archaeon]|nr:hypothetical protein [Candidatus Pacearchaeota archaeon]
MKTICDSCKLKSICKDSEKVTPNHGSCSGWAPCGTTNANDSGGQQ